MQTVDYHYYLVKYKWNTIGEGYWENPLGDQAIHTIDLRTIPDQGTPIIAGGYCFLYSTQEINDATVMPYHLGFGKIAEIVATDQLKDDWFARLGYRPTSATTLLEMLWLQLTDGSDPEGLTSNTPLLSNTNWIGLELPGHSLVHSEPFDIATHPHAQKVRAVYQAEYRRLRESQLGNNGGKKNIHRMYLDVLGEKFKLSNPQDFFIPVDLPKEARVPHETSYTETWSTADSSSLTSSQTWSEPEGNIDIVSNVAQTQSNNIVASGRLESDVSSDDNYAEVDMNLAASSTNLGIVICRFSSSAVTGYALRRFYTGTLAKYRIEKIVSGTTTSLSSEITTAFSMPETWKIQAQTNGSGTDLTAYLNGSSVLTHNEATTSISTGKRGGIRAYRTNSAYTNEFDNFTISDIGGGGGSYTKDLTESISPTDSLPKFIGRSITESVSSVDIGNKQVNRSIQEVASISDLIVKLSSRIFIESISSSDTVESTLVLVKELTELISTSDSLLRGSFKIVSEGLSLVDSEEKSILRQLSETMTANDSLIKSLVTLLDLSEMLGLSDDITAERLASLLQKELTENVNLQDALNKLTLKQVAELLTLADQVSNGTVNILTKIDFYLENLKKPFFDGEIFQ